MLEDEEQMTAEERKRRTATPPGQDYRFSHLDPKTICMTPPRGEDVKIASKGMFV